MRVSERGKELIRKYEGLKLTAYKCPAGILTIGYGHTKTVRPEMSINREMAELLLDEDLKDVERIIKANVKVELNQNQFDSLASFVFNVGAGNFLKSSLLKKINEGKFEEAGNEFLKWTKARTNGGMKELPGLKKRREEEKKIFIGGKNG